MNTHIHTDYCSKHGVQTHLNRKCRQCKAEEEEQTKREEEQAKQGKQETLSKQEKVDEIKRLWDSYLYLEFDIFF